MLENTSKGLNFEHFRASHILRNAHIYIYMCIYTYIYIYICYIIYTQALIVKAWTEKDWIWKQTCLIAICFDKNVQKTLSLFTSSHPTVCESPGSLPVVLNVLSVCKSWQAWHWGRPAFCTPQWPAKWRYDFMVASALKKHPSKHRKIMTVELAKPSSAAGTHQHPPGRVYVVPMKSNLGRNSILSYFFIKGFIHNMYRKHLEASWPRLLTQVIFAHLTFFAVVLPRGTLSERKPWVLWEGGATWSTTRLMSICNSKVIFHCILW